MNDQKPMLSAAMLADALSSTDPDLPVQVAFGKSIFQATGVGVAPDDCDGALIPTVIVSGFEAIVVPEDGDGEA